MDPYKKKYLKYKSKYLSMQSELEQEGGTFSLAKPDIYDNLSEELKAQASHDGKQLLDEWLSNSASNGVNIVLGTFDEHGKKENISATAFSDYYKWTMMPVIWELHDFFKKKNNNTDTLRVTFGIDIRDEKMRNAINTDPELREDIHSALNNLANRQFKREIFEEIGQQPGILRNTDGSSILSKECVDYICGDSSGPRTLAKNVTLNDAGKIPYPDDQDVHIGFYKVAEAKYNPTDKQPGLWFIEARGPWPRVTWLETSLMQAVYEAYLRYNLKKEADKQGISTELAYRRWLYGALLRCARSVAYTRLVQKLPDITMTPALFTGRRTGGYLFLLLQNLFFAHHFNQFKPPPTEPQKKQEWKDSMFSPDGKTPCLGTSSVDCYYELVRLSTERNNQQIICLRPVGTHAHELSMVISVLFPYFDKNKYDLPLTQIIGHELYRALSAEPRRTPAGAFFPMLPDTLGTAAFMKAANWVKMPDNSSFISSINSARQDSGKLENFKKLMEEWNYKNEAGVLKPMMASEIDNAETLLKATLNGYTTSGAGGFFGDSAKVWNPSLSSPSMAVKAVNVEYCVPGDEKEFYEGLGFPHIIIQTKADGTGHVIGYPIKVGDPEDMSKPALAEGKLSLDKTLPEQHIEDIKIWVSNRRIRAFRNMNNDNENIKDAAKRLDITSFTGRNLKPTQRFLASIRG
jgi:nicotinic acid phosphoribosyltransferase